MIDFKNDFRDRMNFKFWSSPRELFLSFATHSTSIVYEKIKRAAADSPARAQTHYSLASVLNERSSRRVTYCSVCAEKPMISCCCAESGGGRRDPNGMRADKTNEPPRAMRFGGVTPLRALLLISRHQTIPSAVHTTRALAWCCPEQCSRPELLAPVNTQSPLSDPTRHDRTPVSLVATRRTWTTTH